MGIGFGVRSGYRIVGVMYAKDQDIGVFLFCSGTGV